jgi:hypothetical protein
MKAIIEKWELGVWKCPKPGGFYLCNNHSAP